MTNKKTLHLPRRSRNVPMSEWRTYERPIPAAWHAMAKRKGFRVDRRVRDRYHVALECKRCGAHTAHKVYTLRSAQPICGGCRASRQHRNATKAGLVFHDRDEAHRHYATYTLPCGHKTRLQRGRVALLAKDGPPPGHSGYHCSICHAEKLQEMAANNGWSLVGADPEGDANYRLLTHDVCGHRQRVATANLETGRFGCGGCGESWVSAPSALYMLRFNVPGFGPCVKLGYSRNPMSRLRYQLGLRDDVEAELIDEVSMPTGQSALQVEKGLHRHLQTYHSDKVIPTIDLIDWINVTSEIYTAHAEPIIRRMLDDVETSHGSRPDQ
ncbi:GIY-YIG nuclease family protein [Lentibacter sp. XHP0401]|uniref:GIY-YIG nuclease family protein n=1 Tax=Lentibacter sp. XHP0401 TaxID=2984334 RepID=UPI0021E9A135|nr:GIY-YIG nuclease family protein [Lentibacter sp. XHP0401]MCV2895000.1 GIY-YIG nuclease family protein [Lentibacter sp. XHP0401]